LKIGQAIKEAREHAGLSQQQLADAIGIQSHGRQRVCEWESGRRMPKMDVLMRVANACNVSLENLLSRIDIDGNP
jgi:transcriptional regulator with XRE-family HTH domain